MNMQAYRPTMHGGRPTILPTVQQKPLPVTQAGASSPKLLPQDSVSISSRAMQLYNSPSTAPISEDAARSRSHISITVNGNATYAKGYKKGNEYMVPLREVWEQLGASVEAEKIGNDLRITVIGDKGRAFKFRIGNADSSTTYAGYKTTDGEKWDSFSLTAEKKGGTVYLSEGTISTLYRVQVTANRSQLEIEQGVSLYVNGDLKSGGSAMRVRTYGEESRYRLFAPMDDLFKKVGANLLASDKYTSTYVKGDTFISVSKRTNEIKITQNGKSSTYDTRIISMDGVLMIDTEALARLGNTSVDWDKATGAFSIQTDIPQDWATRAGSFLYKAAEMGFSFFFGDILTLFDPNATAVDKLLATASLFPQGKILKTHKLVSLVSEFGGDASFIIRTADSLGDIGKVIAKGKKAALVEGNDNYGWKHILKGHVGDPSTKPKGKTLFPTSMTENQIRDFIMEVLDQQKKPTYQEFPKGNPGVIYVKDIYDITFDKERYGIKTMRIVVNQGTGTIITAFPISGSKVVKL